MVVCSVVGCGVNNRTNPDNCTFHRFPMDPVIRGKWLKLIGRIGWSPKKNSSVCSKHFVDMYKKKCPTNTVLFKGAIPTLFVPGKLKERVAPSYVIRDITPPPSSSTSQDQPTYQSKKLLSRIDRLKQKLREKQKKIRCLTAKTRRQAEKLITLHDVFKEMDSSSIVMVPCKRSNKTKVDTDDWERARLEANKIFSNLQHTF